MKRSFYLTLLAVAALSPLGKTNASAQTTTNLIQNGDFTANAASFTSFPGYSGSGNNPAAIPGFTATGGLGLNGTGTGAGSAFEPDGYPNPAFPDPSVYLFIQNPGTATQSINLIAGNEYTISFLSAPRGRQDGRFSVSLTNGATTVYNNTQTVASVGNSIFLRTTDTFTAPAILTGSSTLTLANLGGEGGNVSDFTADFASLSLVDMSPAAAAPEPSTYSLLGVGALALCLVGRRTAKTA